jgi:putative ABC transport system substrate-binding protein
MRRREFLAVCGAWALRGGAAGLLAGAGILRPGRVGAQQSIPTIGLLSPRFPDDSAHVLAALRRGLAETGHVEGRTVRIDYRWTAGDYDSLPAVAEDLVRRRVAVLLAAGGPPSIVAAKAATSTIPIVFVTGGDPAAFGYVASHNRPGGNLTGISMPIETLDSKRLALLHELLPSASRLGFLVNQTFPPAELQVEEAQSASAAIGVAVDILRAGTDGEIERAFARAAEARVAGLAVASDPFFNTRIEKLTALAAGAAIPAIYEVREYVAAGGLASYGVDNREVWRLVGVYAGRVLNGAAPGELPVISPVKLELAVNLKTASALGLTIPPSPLARADEVIE